MTLTPTERSRLCEAHLSMVRSLASRLAARARPYLERDDLVAIGAEALLRATERYDPGRGVSFASFAYLRVRGAMVEGIGTVGPHSRGTVRRRPGRPERTRPLPTILPFDDGRTAPRRGEPMGEILARALDSARLAPRVGDAIGALDRCDQEIIRRHYFGGDSLLEIGRDLGHSKSWASRMHGRALERLRAQLETMLARERRAARAAGAAIPAATPA